MIVVRGLAVVAVAFLVVLAFPIAPADAAIGHKLALTFGAFTAATDVTVDQSNGNVYVTDSGANANVVDVFGAEGGSPAGGIKTPLTGTGKPPNAAFNFGSEVSAVAIDESGGPSNRDLYVSDGKHSVVDKFTLNTTTHEYEYICQLTGVGKGCVSEGGAPTWIEPDGVAVDAGGNLYVASVGPGLGAVSEFNSAGGDVRQFVGDASNKIREAVGVAIASSGTLYINDFHHSVVKLIPEGAASLLDENGSTAVAVDTQHGNVFVDDGSYIAEYNQMGEQVARFGEGAVGTSEGVAVKDSTENVYVSDRGNQNVKVFAPVTIPDVTTGVASNVRKTTAKVSGSVSPAGAGEVHYFFQYSKESTAYNLETSEESTLVSKPVEANLTGLTPGTTYHYRLVAKNANGTNFGKDKTVTTAPAVTFRTCPPIGLRGTSVTLCVLINPEGLETSYLFQYGLSSEYSAGTPLESTGPLTEEKQFTASVGELQPATTYHYHLVASNELGLTNGKDETFTTPPAEPTVNDQPPFATGIALHETTLHGTINPGNGITTYHFQYGTSTAYGSSTPEAYTQLNYQDNSVEQLITALQPGTTYHYRLVSTNSSGTTTGPDETFSTLTGIPPAVETGGAGEISLTAATIAGIIDPAGQTASYEFEIGTSTSYGTQLFGATSTKEEVSAGLAGLLAGTVYHYRLVASSPGGITYGTDQTFATLTPASVIFQPGTPTLLPTPSFPPKEPAQPSSKCKKGFVKKGGKCVRKHHRRPKRKHRK